jgi:phosphohistidine phosphatase
MNLYFLRHGIAEDDSPDGTDASRQLTDEGVSKLRASRLGFARLGVRVDLLLTSPLVRARQTAEIVGPMVGVAPEVADALAPGCDAASLLALLDGRGAERVMIVGHEPDFSGIIGALTGGSRVVMKKGGLARVDLLPGAARGELVWLVPPRGLR